MSPKKPGDPCPKCGSPVISRPGMFYFRGQTFDGLVCCALWCDESKETIFDAAKKAAEAKP